MKNTLFFWCIAVVAVCFAESGSGTSPEGPLDIRPREEAPPSLSFEAELEDAGDADGICEGEETVLLVAEVKNSGTGPANGVRIVLSGSSGLVSRLGGERMVGTIAAGGSATETLSTVLPSLVTAEEGKSLVVKVKEARAEWSCPDSVSFPVAIQPRKGDVVVKPTYDPVDLVPGLRGEDPNALAVVIGISKYREPGVPEVPYAERDAQTMEQYLRNVCGVKATNVLTLYGDKAGSGDFRELFQDKLPLRVKPGSTVYIYYAGHGTPLGKEGRPMLVPYDATAASETKLYPLADIVSAADAWSAKRTFVMVDACFAGEGRVLFAPGRPGIRPDMTALAQGKKCVVLTASSGDQSALDLPEVKHGLFTYYLLKALRGSGDADSDGWVSMKELYEFVREGVSREAAEKLAEEQNPTLLPEGVEGTGAGWKFGRSR